MYIPSVPILALSRSKLKNSRFQFRFYLTQIVDLCRTDTYYSSCSCTGSTVTISILAKYRCTGLSFKYSLLNCNVAYLLLFRLNLIYRHDSFAFFKFQSIHHEIWVIIAYKFSSPQSQNEGREISAISFMA